MKVATDAFLKEHGVADVTRWVELEDQVTPRAVRGALEGKLAYIAEMLEAKQWPEGIAPLAEAAVLSDAEHASIAAVYNTVMVLRKECVLIDLESTPEREIALIKKLATAFPGIVAAVRPIIEHSKRAYTDAKPGVGSISYLG